MRPRGTHISTGRDASRRALPLALVTLALWGLLAATAPAEANHWPPLRPRTPLAGGVDVNCDGPSAELRAEVRNPGTQNVTLTHALLYVYTHEAGKPFWNQPTITNLLLEEEATPTTPARYDFVLSPGEQKGQAQMMSLVPGIDRVYAILWVHVQGEPFWRVARDLDFCQ
jgi:hypothetical protein